MPPSNPVRSSCRCHSTNRKPRN